LKNIENGGSPKEILVVILKYLIGTNNWLYSQSNHRHSF